MNLRSDIANIVSVLRIFIAIGWAWSMILYPNGSWLALTLSSLIIVSDFLDGFLARYLSKVTKFGYFLDRTIDRIAILIGLTALVEIHRISLILVFLYASRDLVFFNMGEWFHHKIGRPSQWRGSKFKIGAMFGVFLISSFPVAWPSYLIGSLTLAIVFFFWLELFFFWRAAQKEIVALSNRATE